MLKKIFGDSVGGAIKAVADVAGEYFESADERRNFEKFLLEREDKIADRFAEVDKANIELNKEEAKGNWFQSSWRPLVGWFCALAFGLKFLVFPLLVFIAGLYGVVIVPPEINWAELSVVLMGMLGMSGLRTYERLRGVGK